MSTAQKFTALGAGNGFPFCLITNQDYFDNYFFWSRVKFPGSTQSEKLKNASYFFWRLKSFTNLKIDYTIFLTNDDEEFRTGFFEIQNNPSGQPAFFGGGESNLLSVYEPHKRPCIRTGGGELLIETMLETVTEGLIGEGYLYFNLCLDENEDVCLIYQLEGFDPNGFLIISHFDQSPINSVSVPLKVGPNENDIIDLTFYGLGEEGRRDRCRIDSALIEPEYWEFE